MGAGASASEQSQLLAEARAQGATQEEIDAYIAENNLNTAQRPAQTQPSHAQLTQMGFSPDAVAMALSLGLESMEDAIQWCIDHPDAGGGNETDADVNDEEALLHYAIAESILQKSRDNDLTTDEKRLVPWATEMAELHARRTKAPPGEQPALRARLVANRGLDFAELCDAFDAATLFTVPRGGTAAALRRRVAGFDSARDYFLRYGATLDERTCGAS